MVYLPKLFCLSVFPYFYLPPPKCWPQARSPPLLTSQSGLYKSCVLDKQRTPWPHGLQLAVLFAEAAEHPGGAASGEVCHWSRL